MHERNACIVFAKRPEIGKVKTRLAVGTNSKFASLFYERCCRLIVSECQSGKNCWDCVVAYSPPDAKSWFEKWLSPSVQMTTFEPQSDSPDLGERMQSAVRSALKAGARKVVLVGSDVPDISAGILHSAFAALDYSQIVLGPAKDGGYYLIGGTVMPETLLEGIAWSTSTVLEATVSKCRKAGLAVDTSSLPELQDIDTHEDLRSWLATADESHALRDAVERLISEELN